MDAFLNTPFYAIFNNAENNSNQLECQWLASRVLFGDRWAEDIDDNTQQ
jgi:hypothetical protein